MPDIVQFILYEEDTMLLVVTQVSKSLVSESRLERDQGGYKNSGESVHSHSPPPPGRKTP